MSGLAIAERFMSVTEVAEILAVSEETVRRQFEGREGVIDLGAAEKLHKRKKRLLRISQLALNKFLNERQVKVRSSGGRR